MIFNKIDAKFILVLALLIISCKPSTILILYKDKQSIMKPNYTNSIKDFNWELKAENILDTLIFKRKNSEKVYAIIKNLENIPNNEKSMGIPRYAFILEYNHKKDTLYFYDFNDENYKNEAYLVQNDITLQDSNNLLKKYLFKHHEKFIRREYYQLPSNKKERFYYNQ